MNRPLVCSQYCPQNFVKEQKTQGVYLKDVSLIGICVATVHANNTETFEGLVRRTAIPQCIGLACKRRSIVFYDFYVINVTLMKSFAADLLS